MTKTKKTNKTELVVMGYFVEQITDIYGMFVGSNESIRSIYINQDLNDDRYLKTNDLVINTFETVDGAKINREYVFRNDIISKDHLEMVWFKKDIKEKVA